MISTRDIRRKIKTIRNIQQLCRAMKTVSLVKLQKAEARLAAARPYATRMAQSLGQLSAALAFAAEQSARRVVIVVTSDKGLAGGYNASLLRAALSEVQEAPIIAIGRKGERFFRRRGNEILDSLTPLGTEPVLASVLPLADRLAQRLRRGEVSTIGAVYGHFLHGTRSEIVNRTIFPVEAPPQEAILEPEAPQLAEMLLGRYLRAALYSIVLEASASEHGARVAAMSAASDNAEEMIDELTMDYNRARQAIITKELSEIVSSAEALS